MPAKAALHTPAQIHEVTGFTVPQQNQIYARHTVLLSSVDKKPTGSGTRRLISSETAYRLAILAKGIKTRVQPRHIANAAKLFAIGQHGRPANTLYPFGRTLLILKEGSAEIVNAPFEASLTDICGRPFEAAIIIDIGQIIKTTNEAIILTKKDTK
jgi:hypothetical protein